MSLNTASYFYQPYQLTWTDLTAQHTIKIKTTKAIIYIYCIVSPFIVL